MCASKFLIHDVYCSFEILSHRNVCCSIIHRTNLYLLAEILCQNDMLSSYYHLATTYVASKFLSCQNCMLFNESRAKMYVQAVFLEPHTVCWDRTNLEPTTSVVTLFLSLQGRMLIHNSHAINVCFDNRLAISNWASFVPLVKPVVIHGKS